jgi:Lrp/AsnC family transcriptional regulator, regulator for asnA, asnC and gidA
VKMTGSSVSRDPRGTRPTTVPAEAAAIGHLDEVDRALIARLEVDTRAPYAHLGAAVGLSADAARERVRRLRRDRVVEFVAAVSPSMLGIHRVALVGLRTKGPLDGIAAALSRILEIDFVVAVAGRYNLLVELMCRDGDELLRVLTQITSIAGVEVAQAYSYLRVWKWNVGGGRTPLKADLSDTTRPSAGLDDIDRLLTAELQRDARASFSAMASNLNLSYSLVRRRVQALLGSGAVSLVTVVNRITTGTATLASVGLRTEGEVRSVARAITALPEVEIAIMTTGPFDMLLEVAAASEADLGDVVERIRSIHGVKGTETHEYLRIFKLPISWSPASGDTGS